MSVTLLALLCVVVFAVESVPTEPDAVLAKLVDIVNGISGVTLINRTEHKGRRLSVVNRLYSYYYYDPVREPEANGLITNTLHFFYIKATEDGIIKVEWPSRHSFDYFNWDDYTDLFAGGELTHSMKKDVINLREYTVKTLLDYSIRKGSNDRDSFAKSEKWFEKIGSNALTSDYDFTYVKWTEPRRVVPNLIRFCNKFFEIYRAWPLTVFDLNFYVSSTFIDANGWAALGGNKFIQLRSLFTEIEYGSPATTIYAFSHDFGGDYPSFLKQDKWLAHYMIIKKMKAFELGTYGEGFGDFELPYLEYSEIFYYVIHQLISTEDMFGKTEALIQSQTPILKIYLKTLAYLMKYYADEAYISNEALQYMRDPAMTGYDDDHKYIAVLDNFAFVVEYFVTAYNDDNKDKEEKLFYFIDRAFKYIKRIGDLLNLNKHWMVAKDDKMGFAAFANIDKYKAINENYDNDAIIDNKNWYGLAMEWTRKWPDGAAKGKTIRGDVENNKILSHYVARLDPLDEMVMRGKLIWTAVKKKASEGIEMLFDRSAVARDKKGGSAAVWSNALNTIRERIKGIVEDGLKNTLKENVHCITYNVRGRNGFIGGIPARFQFENEQIRIVRAHKKYARKGQKLSISTDGAYNYMYKNPWNHPARDLDVIARRTVPRDIARHTARRDLFKRHSLTDTARLV